MTINKDKLFLEVTDYSVSKENFQLFLDEELNMLVTTPQPSLEKLPSYYESEDYISHTDGKRSLFEKIYQVVKNKAIKNKLKLVNSQTTKGRILDIGTGTGDFLVAAKDNGWKTIGIEPNEKAKSIARNKGVTFVENLQAIESNTIDIVTMWHVLEHVPNLEEYILEFKRILKTTGTLIIAVPNFNSFDANYYGKHWAAYDVPRHLWHFSKFSIKKIFSEYQFELTQILPMKFDSYYVSLLSEKYKTGKMNFLKAFWIGFKSNKYGKQNLEFSSHIYVLKNKNE
jgi:ubiquinone/menaquinone biosynthesis C-methylase UbiE